MHDAEMALTTDGTILGVNDVFLYDTGAYDPYGLTIPINSQCTLLGPYDIAELRQRVHRRLHQQDDRDAGARRGPPARRVRERAAARLRGRASWASTGVEIRKRNLHRAGSSFPHNHEIMFQDSAPLIYDSGDYLPTLERGRRA